MMNLTDMKTVRSILGKHGFHFSKKLGQNFLIDPSVCPRIADEGNAASGYGVLEIGPGIGTLTQQLALRAEKVTSVELDQRLLPILEDAFQQKVPCIIDCPVDYSENTKLSEYLHDKFEK